MAWFDIAAGLAQGAQQGIDRVQADMVRRKADAFKDAQEKRALAAEARTASEDRRRQIAEEFDRQDPMNINPEFVASLSDPEKRQFLLLDKANNTWKARMDPLAETKRRNETRMAEDAPEAFAVMKENRGRDTGTARERDAARISWNSGKVLGSDSNIWTAGRLAGASEDEIVRRLSAKGQQEHINRQPGVRQAEIAAGTAKASQASDYAVAVLKNGLATAQDRKKAVGSFLESIKDFEPAAQAAALANFYKQTGYEPPSASGGGAGSAATSGPTWDPVANAWK